MSRKLSRRFYISGTLKIPPRDGAYEESFEQIKQDILEGIIGIDVLDDVTIEEK